MAYYSSSSSDEESSDYRMRYLTTKEYSSSDESDNSTFEDIIAHEKGKVKCTLCNVFIPDNENCIQQHINGNNHDMKNDRRMALRNSIEYDDNYCRLCEETFENLLDHIDTQAHQSEMERINELETEFIDLPNQLNDPPNARCTICNCNLSFRYNDLDAHIAARRHRIARAQALKPLNGIFNIENNNEQLWCKICDDEFVNTVDDIFEHVDNDENHITMLKTLQDLIEDEDIDIRNYLTDVFESKAQCNKCKVPVPCHENNLTEHIEGNQHSG